MLQPAATYEELRRGFRWQIPERYNIAVDTVDRHAEATPEALALIYEDADGRVERYSFRDIKLLSNRAANMLAGHGIARGERVAILLGQRPATAIAHVACFKSGILSIPMFTLFGEEALAFRLENAEAAAVITDRENYPKIAAIREAIPSLRHVFVTDGAEAGAVDFRAELDKASDVFRPVDTAADEPAFISYTSGTTGQPKGALHAHRTMLGHMPGFDMLHAFFGQKGDLSWSPADWAWLAGLMDVLFPTWQHGFPVLCFRTAGPFDPEQAFHMVVKHEVRNTLFVPTMLKLMRQVPNPPKTQLRSILCGGETVGAELHEWANGFFGFPLHEGYGQTECNLVTAHVPSLMECRFGSIGKAVPGHEAAIVDDEGRPVRPGEEGHLAFRAPNPVMLLEYWRNRQATADKYRGEWLITGDRARMDEDGYIWFVGRDDDVITSSGYRIGPGEIEDCLAKHPAVAVAAAIGVPDPVRTEIIKVFIVPTAAAEPGPALEADIRAFVKDRLARHEYPREIEFVRELPTTATGKVMRRTLKERELEGRKPA